MTMLGVEILPNGDLAIAEAGANRIRVVNAGPDGVVNGDPNERIRTIAGFSENTWDTSLLRFNGDGYALSTAFNYPLDVVVDPRGGIDVVDAGFNRIRHVGLLTPSGNQPDLAVTAAASASQVSAFEAFSYVVTMSNLTPRATTAALNVTLDPNVRFDSSTPAICSTASGTLTCDVGSLTSELPIEVRLHVTPMMLGTATATFVVSNPDGDADVSNNTATVIVTSGLTIRETIVVSDAVEARPAVMVLVNEAITVSDAVTPQPAVMLEVNETIVVSDAVTTAAFDEADLAITVVPSRTLLNVGDRAQLRGHRHQHRDDGPRHELQSAGAVRARESIRSTCRRSSASSSSASARGRALSGTSPRARVSSSRWTRTRPAVRPGRPRSALPARSPIRCRQQRCHGHRGRQSTAGGRCRRRPRSRRHDEPRRGGCVRGRKRSRWRRDYPRLLDRGHHPSREWFVSRTASDVRHAHADRPCHRRAGRPGQRHGGHPRSSGRAAGPGGHRDLGRAWPGDGELEPGAGGQRVPRLP